MADSPPTHDPPNWDWSPRWSVAKYQRMFEVGVFSAEDKVELVDGYILIKDPEGPPHDGAIGRVKVALANLPAPWRLRIQPTAMLPDSQLEPDVAVVRGSALADLNHHPARADTGLVVEVADATLVRDQRDKTRIYARAGIPVYWIINLVGRRVEVYSQPSGPTAVPAYGAFQTFQPGDQVPLVLDGITVGSVPAADLLP